MGKLRSLLSEAFWETGEGVENEIFP